ncbi:MAG: hypothetical protein H6Q42_1894, partial [Deltaproteobacteria bacterium]|nr:hypothetical protein [Deltaproteobacteria bacterium]
MAEVISNQTGWQVDTSIIQINDVAHTGKGAIDRLFAQAEFEGDVVPGATYVILDDVVTTGGTLANLKGFIESKGGRVKAIQTIGAAQFATNLKIMPATLKKLREAYGQSLKEVLDFVYGGPIHEENLTESEARTFIRNKGEIFERKRKARDEGKGRQGFSLGQRRAPQRTLPPKELTSPKGWKEIEGGKEPGPKIRQDELSNIAALVERIAHSRVFFPENIPIDLRDPANQAGLKKHGYTDEEIGLYISEGYTAHNVGGRMTPVLVSPTKWQAIISVAVEGKTAWQVKATALHEAFEAVRDFMLTKEEREILDRKMPGWGNISTSEIQAEAFADYVMGKKGRLVPRSVQTAFDKIKAFFERLANYLHGLGYKSAEDIFHKAKTGEIRERYVRQPARLSPPVEQAPAFKLERTISKFIDTLKSPDFPARAEQDKGFKEMIRKNRLGLVKVTDNDLKLWERALSLPFWLQDKYRELRPLVHTQMSREESRSEIIHGLLSRARAFFELKGEEMGRAEKALIEGDRGGKVYTDEELRG